MTYLTSVITEGMMLIEAKKILRESIIDNLVDATLVIQVFGQDKPITNALEERRKVISTYEELVGLLGTNKQSVAGIGRSIEIWKEEIAVIEKALEITGYRIH